MYEKAREDPVAVADGILSLLGKTEPTPSDLVGATAIGEAIVNLNAFMRGLGKG